MFLGRNRKDIQMKCLMPEFSTMLQNIRLFEWRIAKSANRYRSSQLQSDLLCATTTETGTAAECSRPHVQWTDYAVADAMLDEPPRPEDYGTKYLSPGYADRASAPECLRRYRDSATAAISALRAIVASSCRWMDTSSASRRMANAYAAAKCTQCRTII